MPTLNPTALTKDSLYQLIAQNPVAIGRTAVMNSFGSGDEIREQVDQLLTILMAEGKINSDNDRNYQATHPWADVAYAVVGPVAYDRRLSIPIKLLNIPDDVNIQVTMSRDELNRKKLREGDKIVVGLVRNNHNHTDLRARYLAHAQADKPFHLTGTFNHKARVFAPLDRSIKADFKFAKEPEPTDVPRQFLVELPTHFDIRDPVIRVTEDQTRNMTTGAAISWIITNKHQIAHAHPEDVLREAGRINRRKLDFTGRVDLTHLDFVTVDPLGAPDLDDAFVAVEESDGYSIYTGISDVPALVSYNTAVDREAYERGITYYLSDHTSHMLPELISTKKASLIPQQDRLAIVIKQTMGWDCVLKDFEIIPAVIRSRNQFSYGQFYDLLEREDERFKIIASIHEARRRNGMNAHLNMFMKDSADKYVTKSIVETLMVQSNSLIAQFLKAGKIPFLSRNFEQYSSPEAQKRGLVSRAYYASYQLGHSNLGFEFYAHGTSPIRRYADIINLRAVHRALGREDIGLHDDEIRDLDQSAGHLNNRRRVERDIAHDTQKYHAIGDLIRLQAAPVRVGIHEIGADYLEVTIVQTGIRQRIAASALTSAWRIDGKEHQLVLMDQQGRDLRRYNRGEAVLGQISDVDPVRARWNISLLPQEQGLRPSVAKPS